MYIYIFMYIYIYIYIEASTVVPNYELLVRHVSGGERWRVPSD